MTPTVHVLLYGHAVCGNVHGLPKDWGGAKWVPLSDWKQATCATCKEVAEKLTELVVGPIP